MTSSGNDHYSQRLALSAIAAVIAAFVTQPGVASAAENLAPNPHFHEGTDKPSGWRLSGGDGRWIDRQILEVTGTGGGSNQWQSEPARFQSGGLYRFEMRARQTAGSGGCIISGPGFANRDYPGMASEWKDYGHVFRVPDGIENGILRVGQWESKGTVQFDSVRLVHVIPIHRQVGKLLLGEGESIKEGYYAFQSNLGYEGSNYSRTLIGATAGFNSDRWCLGGAAQVIYRFGLPGHRFLSADMAVTVGWHSHGGCLIEVSRDGKAWRTLATQSGVGTARATLPADIFPAESITLGLHPAKNDGNFQVHQVEFQARLDGHPAEGIGKTIFGEVASRDYEKGIESITLDENPQSAEAVLCVVAKNPTQRSLAFRLKATVKSPGDAGTALPPQVTEIAAGQKATLEIKIPTRQPGQHLVELNIGAGLSTLLQTSLRIEVPSYYRSDYGELVTGDAGTTAVWWCDATRKIPRRRPLPQATGPAAKISAARNDREAVQIVVHPAQTLTGLTASAGVLAGPGGATIPAKSIKVLRVYYHFVDHPTDATGVRDWWPDALPPLDRPINVQAGENQPLWILVYVPKDAKAGDYSGTLSLKADGFSADVPIRLHVWDFALPERNHLQTAFGFSPGEAFRYHQVTIDADRRKLVDLYYQSFAEHRISTYRSGATGPFPGEVLRRREAAPGRDQFRGF